MRTVTWVVMLAACEDKTGGTTATSGDTATQTVPEAPTFTEVNSEVFVPNCALSGCHSADSDPQLNGFVFPTGGAYEALVNVPATMAGQTLVVPGDAQGSYLVLKVEDAIGIQGSPMPPPVGGLDPAQIAMIRAWIDAGAAND
jgi:hypothetical protein